MNQHASINRVFRLVWNESLSSYVPAAETARGRGKSSRRKLAAVALSLAATIAQAAPVGGQVTGGSGTITQSGSTTTIQQSSQNLSLNWQAFNVAAQETVDFAQPNTTAIAVNRVSDVNGSVILGHLNANGQVFLINPNGVLFGKGAEVNVGGLVASTLDLNDNTLADASKIFSGGGTGGVVNEGTLTAANGGVIALLGNRVNNTGVISARLGSVALGSGSAATLTFQGTNLVSMQIDQSVLNSAASNGGLIRADGGQVLMIAGAQKALLASVVNNTGIIEARTLEDHEGTITLLGGMDAGTVYESGTLDASAPVTGNGGFINTSAAHVQIAGSAKITTAAAMGLTGSWLIDPQDFTIAASGGDMTGATLSNELASNNVQIQSSQGATAGSGDINVNDAVAWAAHTLTLTAAHNVNVNAVMSATGSASLDLEPATTNGADSAVSGGAFNVGLNDAGFTGRVDFTSSGTLTIGGQPYTVISSLGSGPSDTSAGTLQGVQGNLTGNFALGSNIDASATAGWSSGAGFSPLGNGNQAFTGSFNGLGHTISGLTAIQPNNEDVGLFGGAVGATISNVGLIANNVNGALTTGGLIGYLYSGTVTNSYALGTVVSNIPSSSDFTGGLIGEAISSAIGNTYSAGSVTGIADVGGLIGLAETSAITNSHSGASVTANGVLTGTSGVGGLVGQLNSTFGVSSVSTSYSTGSVTDNTGSNGAGGLVGYLNGNPGVSFLSIPPSAATISNSYSTSNVTGGNNVGGLAGQSNYGVIQRSHASGTVSGANYTGGLVGYNQGTSSISTSYATGSVTGGRYTGGLVGQNYGSVSTSFATGNVTGTLNVGGLIGANSGVGGGSAQYSYATGNVTGGDVVGGLVGFNYGLIANSYSNGSVNALGATYAGGLVGLNYAILGGNNFYNSTTNSTLTGVGTTADVAGTVWGMSATAFLSHANFTSATPANGNVNPAWDFNSTWFQYDGNTTPLLQAFMTPLTVSGTTARSYNGAVFAPTISNLTYSIVPDASHLFGTVTVTGTAVGASHAGTYVFTPGGLYSDQLGYMISYATGSLTISPAPLTVAGSTANKVYDGTTATALTGGTLVGVFGSDTVGLIQSGTFATKNAGVGIAVTATDSLSGASAADYSIVEPTGLTGVITAATLTVGGATAVASKSYDGTTTASLSGGTLSGVVTGDSVTLAQAGNFATKNAGVGIAVTATDSLSGASAADYSIVEPTGLTGVITAATLTVGGATVVASKTYDGTTIASLSGGTLSGVMTGDSVTLAQAGNFATKNAGVGISVTATDSLNGASAGDYSIVEPTGLTGSITPATLTVGGATTVVSKTYDGTTIASLSGGTLSGVVTGDSVTLAQAGSFATKNAGIGIAVTATDSLNGASANDYAIVEPTGLTGSITPATLTVNGTVVGTQVYDGTTVAALNGGSLVGLIGSDSVTLVQAGIFAAKNAGSGIAVTAVDGLNGASASDYTIVEPTGLTGSITAAPLAVSGTTVASKVYNGTNSASLGGGALVGVISGDTVTLNQSGTFGSTGVGVGIAVTSTDTLSGVSADDYSIVQPMGLFGAILPPPSSPGGLSNVLNARAQIVENLIYPQMGTVPQAINASPTIVVLEAGADSGNVTTDPHRAVAVNVSMKIGANGTLKIENGGLRLPSNLVVGNE